MTSPFRDGAGQPIRSIRGLNSLPEAHRMAAYRTLLPGEVFQRFGLDPSHPVDAAGRPLLSANAEPGSLSVEIEFRHQAEARDPVVYAHLADTQHNQIIILLYVVNDPDSPRFDIDRNWSGQRTKLGTLSRNVEAELAAMQAGLAPGQVRRGLHITRALLGCFETFLTRLGHDMFLLEPLAYHVAIIFERYGCAYSQGLRKMQWIHEQFQPGGELWARLNGSTPFRMPGAHGTVRGRSWAIQDGILGEPYTNIHMHKQVGRNAGICTFPDAVW